MEMLIALMPLTWEAHLHCRSKSIVSKAWAGISAAHIWTPGQEKRKLCCPILPQGAEGGHFISRWVSYWRQTCNTLQLTTALRSWIFWDVIFIACASPSLPVEHWQENILQCWATELRGLSSSSLAGSIMLQILQITFLWSLLINNAAETLQVAYTASGLLNYYECYTDSISYLLFSTLGLPDEAPFFFVAVLCCTFKLQALQHKGREVHRAQQLSEAAAEGRAHSSISLEFSPRFPRCSRSQPVMFFVPSYLRASLDYSSMSLCSSLIRIKNTSWQWAPQCGKKLLSEASVFCLLFHCFLW